MITKKGRCAKHKPAAGQERKEYARYKDDRPSAAKRGYNHNWRKARLSYLKRHPLCVHCLKEGRTTEANEVDHIVPHRGDNQLFHDVNNWQALCSHHHSKKTNEEKKLYKGGKWWEDK